MCGALDGRRRDGGHWRINRTALSQVMKDEDESVGIGGILSTIDVATRLGCSERQIRYLDTGALPDRRAYVGENVIGTLRFREDDLVGFFTYQIS